MTKILKTLDNIADVVLRYRPKPKSVPAKNRRLQKILMNANVKMITVIH